MSDTTELYRYFDKNDNLLYVGISKSAIVRRSQHQGASHWYNKHTKVTTERFSTKREALNAERKAIKAEKPIHNVIHNEKKHLNTKALLEVTLEDKTAAALMLYIHEDHNGEMPTSKTGMEGISISINTMTKCVKCLENKGLLSKKRLDRTVYYVLTNKAYK